MPITIELLHSQPQTEIYSRIRDLVGQSQKVSIAVGFLTVAGISLVKESLQVNPSVLKSLTVGATTLKACEGLDQLLSIGVPRDNLKVYLGHTRGDPSKFTKYHPKMHSKDLFESDDSATAIVGSHNMTGFALGGQNWKLRFW